MRRILFFLVLLFLTNSLLLAQKTTCPCQNCPGQIADGVEGPQGIPNGTFRSTQTFHINIFNVLNNQLSNSGQCVKEVWVKFKHDYLGDIEIFLVAPDGQEVQLIGPVSTTIFGSTSNTTFDVSFVRNAAIAAPEDNLEKTWHNEQDWGVFGTRKGSYFPYIGKLEDLNQGRVNGTWTLRIHDGTPDGNDTGELLDFGIEFCDPTGLVCDPCEEEKEAGIPCIFQVEGSKEQITPIEFVCVDVLAKNVAFVKSMQWAMTWDPTVITDAFVQNTNANIPDFSNNDFQIDNATGTIALDYQLPDTDSLGAVVADSSLLFQVCFNGAGEEGDSTVFAFDNLQVVNIEEEDLLTDASDGSVLLTVDLTADCATATQLCDKTTITVETTKGPGFEKNEGDAACWGNDAEIQSKWFQFDVLETGSFDFMVQPLAAAGFRYFLYKSSCGGEVMSCFAGRQNDDSPIGISDDPIATFGIDGKFGESLLVEKGETYFLVVDNQDNNSVGFNLLFGGTAALGDQTLTAVIAPPPVLDCERSTIILNTDGTATGTQYDYTWETADGNFTDTADEFAPILDAPGTYILQVTDTDTKCSISTSIRINSDREFPSANAGDSFTLSCTSPEYTLNGAGSSSGTIFAYEWTTFDGGNFIENNNNLTALIDRPGAYVLAVTDTTNRCTTRDTVLISESVDRPNLTVDSSAISCTNPTTIVRASSDTEGVNITWTGEDLTTPHNGTTFSTTIPGTYTVTATAPNGCTKTEAAIIRDDRVFPTTKAGEDFTLTCATPVFQLAADSSSQGSNFSYEWRTEDGHFVDEDDRTFISPQVDSAGTYILQITDASNGCEATDTVLIQQTFELPTVALNSATLLTCFEESITIDASQSDTGAIFDFNWTIEEGGNIQSGINTYQPVLDQGGVYIFTIINSETGCTNQDTVRISESQDKPNLSTTQGTITCTGPSITLSATSDTLGVTFEWASDLLATSQSGDSIIIDLPGEYQVTALAPNGCTTQQSIRIADDRLTPTLEVSADDTLTCAISSLDLVASSTTPNTQLVWYPPAGDSLINNEIEATQAGSYIQIATAPNGCFTRDTVQIYNDENAPVAIIEMPDSLSCLNNFITLDASMNSSIGEPFIYTWTTEDGQFLTNTNANTLQIDVQQAGTYQLNVYDSSNDCETQDTVKVIDISENPTLLLNKPRVDTLSCLDTVLQYMVNTNATDPSYEWTFNGSVLSNTDELNITQPGAYTLTIIDQENSCPTVEELQISIDTITPIADAGSSQTLNCAVGMITLDGTNSSQGNQFSYLWTNESGATVSTNLTTEISREGLYNLRVINTRSGCRTQDEVRITAALDNPIAKAGADTVLCTGNEDTFTLGTMTTSEGADFEYEWRTEDGEVLGNERFLNVLSEGIYTLNVLNTSNQCEAIDTIEVVERPRPNITVETVGGINCRDNLITYIAKSDMPQTKIRWDGQEVFEDTLFRATDALEGATYIAFGINEDTGCSNFSNQVIIMADRTPPIVNIGTNAILNCSDTLRLDGSQSQQDERFDYSWSTENGNILSPADSLSIMVDEPGTYQLRIFNRENFCSNQDTLVVEDNRKRPNIELPELEILTCNQSAFDLGSDTFPTSSTLFYTWQSPSGEIVGNKPILPNIQEAGTYILEVIDSFNLCATIDSTEIIENIALPEITIEEATRELDCQNPTTILTATSNIEGTYQWTTQQGNIQSGATTLTPIVNAGGTYQLRVINEATGCQETTSIEVIDNQERPQIDAGQNTTITCYNDSLVTLTGRIQSAETNLLLEWTAANNPTLPLSDSLKITIAEAGVYYLKATNPTTSCTQLDSVVVGNNIQPIAFSIPTNYPNIDCRSPELEIGPTDLIMADTIMSNWTTEGGIILGASDLSTIIIGKAGIYNLEVVNTLNGCVSAATVTIDAEGELPIAEAGPDQTLTCAIPMIQLGTDRTSSGPNFSYQWTRTDGATIPNNTDRFLTVEEAGTYELIVQNTDTGCEEFATITISEKTSISEVIFPSNTSISCDKDQLTLKIDNRSDDPLSYQWTAVAGTILSPTNEQEIIVNQPGTYQVTVTDLFSECIKEETILVEDNRQPPPVDLGADRILRCDEPMITLASAIPLEGNFSFTWQDENNNTIARTPAISVDQAGIYELSILNQENGCEATAQITIAANSNQPRGAVLSVNPPSCIDSRNASILVNDIVGGNGPYQIELNNESNTDNVFDNLLAGEYVLSVMDTLACTWDTTLVIEAPDALAVQIQSSTTQLETGGMVNLMIDGDIDLNSLAFIDWQPTDLFSCADCIEQTLTLLTDTEIELSVVDENGCEGFASQFIEVRLAEMPNAITPNGDGSNDFLRIPAIEATPDQYPDNELIIFNRWGDIVYKAAPYQNDWDGSQNGQPVPEGTYYYVLRLDVSEGVTMKGMITVLR